VLPLVSIKTRNNLANLLFSFLPFFHSPTRRFLTTAGFASRIGHISADSAAMVVMLEKLGAIIHCRTNIPQTLLVRPFFPRIRPFSSTHVNTSSTYSATNPSTTSSAASSTRSTPPSLPAAVQAVKQLSSHSVVPLSASAPTSAAPFASLPLSAVCTPSARRRGGFPTPARVTSSLERSRSRAFVGRWRPVWRA
jgi:hypothetical protein